MHATTGSVAAPWTAWRLLAVLIGTAVVMFCNRWIVGESWLTGRSIGSAAHRGHSDPGSLGQPPATPRKPNPRENVLGRTASAEASSATSISARRASAVRKASSWSNRCPAMTCEARAAAASDSAAASSAPGDQFG